MATKFPVVKKPSDMQSAFMVAVNSQFAKSVIQEGRVKNESLQTLVNRSIDDSFNHMASVGIFSTGDDTTPAILKGTIWDKLTEDWKGRKGNSIFFHDTGKMRRQLEAIKKPSTLLGGYLTQRKGDKEFVIKPSQSIDSDGNLKQANGKVKPLDQVRMEFRFSIFKKLNQALAADNGPELFRKIDKTLYHKLSVRRKDEGPYKRELLRSYFTYYSTVVIPKAIQQAMKGDRK